MYNLSYGIEPSLPVNKPSLFSPHDSAGQLNDMITQLNCLLHLWSFYYLLGCSEVPFTAKVLAFWVV